MASNLPMVTVLTPAYNQGSFLAETIDSVLGQAYPNVEFIVIDDGSTDDTARVLEGYAGRLTVVRHLNMGESRTVNKGWAMSRGDYVTIVNADDPLLPGMLHKAVGFMEQRPELLVVYPDWVSIDSSSKPRGPAMCLDYNYGEMIQNWRCLPGPGALMRRRALSLEPARDTRYRYVADFEYWLRLGLRGPMARLPECLATHRVHPGSASVSRRPGIGQELLQMFTDFFCRPDLPEGIRRLKHRAISSANIAVAAMLRLDRQPYAGYLLQSIRNAPWFGSRSILQRALSVGRKRCARMFTPPGMRRSA